MIVLARPPEDPDTRPVQLAVAFTRVELVYLGVRREVAFDGSAIGLEGTDFLFLAASDDRIERRFKRILSRLAPKDTPKDFRFPVVAVEKLFVWLPVDRGDGSFVHVIAFTPHGSFALATGDTLRYRAQIFGAGVIDMPQGVYARSVGLAAVRAALRRGAALQTGSLETHMRVTADRTAAAEWVRSHSGLDTHRPPGDDEFAVEVRKDDPPEWLAKWGPRPS